MKHKIFSVLLGELGGLQGSQNHNICYPVNRIPLDESPRPTASVGGPLPWFLHKFDNKPLSIRGSMWRAAERSFHASLPAGGMFVATTRQGWLCKRVHKFVTTHIGDKHSFLSFTNGSLPVKGRDLHLRSSALLPLSTAKYVGRFTLLVCVGSFVYVYKRRGCC